MQRLNIGSDQSTRIDSHQTKIPIPKRVVINTQQAQNNLKINNAKKQEIKTISRTPLSLSSFTSNIENLIKPMSLTSSKFYETHKQDLFKRVPQIQNKSQSYLDPSTREIQTPVLVSQSKSRQETHASQSYNLSQSRGFESRVKFIPKTPKIEDLREHIKEHSKHELSTRRVNEMTKRQLQKKLGEIKKNIAAFQQQFKEEPKQDFRNQYALRMFQEDIRFENLKTSIQIYDRIEHAKKPKQQKLLYFYHVNSRDEVNHETKLIKNEVRQGMTDPVRTAAIIELQNFIKKNIGKKKIMNNIAEVSTHKMMVSSNNKQPINEIGAMIAQEFDKSHLRKSHALH